MRKQPVNGYEKAGEGKCWEQFLHELSDSPYCHKDEAHDGDHEGYGVRWTEEPQVDVDTATRFLKAYRRIPNQNHEIWLNHDGTVTMTLRGLEAAVRFLGVMPSSDY